VDDGQVGDLTSLGLTTYEAKAYLGLVRRDSATAAEVARLGELPRQRVYDVLASLVEKGLAVARPGPVVKYSASDPEQAIGRLVSDHRKQLSELERRAKDIVGKLAPAYRAGRAQTDPLEYIEVLRDRRAVNKRFAELQKAIEREILVFTKPPYATPVQDEVTGLEVARRHTARSVYELSAFDDPTFADGVRRFIEAGEEARFVSELPLKLVIIDESIVLFGMEDPVAGASDVTIMVVEHAHLAAVLKIAFDAVWASALTFEEAGEQVANRAATSA